MAGGRIVRSGDKDLALELEEYGYSELNHAGNGDPSVPVGATP
jgi:Fe-S cluster assembly ATPase SufC